MVPSVAFVISFWGAAIPLSQAGQLFPRANSTANPINGSSPFEWSTCFNSTLIECSTFSTPLDYANPQAGNASLAVIRYKAIKSPKLGTLWTNPGGPGGSGIAFIASGTGELLSNATGGYYDIASWDPRGVNNSLPQVKCFETEEDSASFWKDSGEGLEVKDAFNNPQDIDALHIMAGKIDSLLIDLGRRCANMSGDSLKYVGTAAAVRDMVAMNDALETPGGLINYWGFSYGTVLGAYFVNLFPDRVGRVVLDGVVHPDVWANHAPYENWQYAIQDAEKALEGFAETCAAAGKDKCAISKGKNATEVHQWVMDLLAAAYDGARSGIEISSAEIRQAIHSSMYWPTSWDSLSQWLLVKSNMVKASPDFAAKAGALSLDDDFELPSKPLEEIEAELLEKIRAADPSGSWDPRRRLGFGQGLLVGRKDPVSNNTSPDYSNQAIACADAHDANYDTTVVADELIGITQQESAVFGPQWGFAMLFCHRWPARAVERFTGPWNQTLRNPILVIGNEADPITPLSNAKYVVEQLGSSAVLVERAGYGHTTKSMHSSCIINTVSEYFISNKLPTSGSRCSTDQPLYSDNDERVADTVPMVSNLTVVTEDNSTNYTTKAAANSQLRNSGGALSGTTLGVFAAGLAIGIPF